MNARDLAAGAALTIVTLRGKLVNLRDAGGRTANTSVTAGDRGCEIMCLEELRIARL